MELIQFSVKIIFMFSMTSLGTGSLYDPHLFPEAGPFFEGWYMRISDFDTGDSIGLLFGSVLPSSPKNISGPLVVASILLRKCDENNLCKLISTNGKFKIEDFNVFVRGQTVTEDPDMSSPANFTWKVDSKNNGGHFEQNGNTTAFIFRLGELVFRGEATHPFPWNDDGTGPEGWLVYLPLPLHWFVFSLSSELTYYEIQNITSGEVINGENGAVHLEKNWGQSFPKKWIWSEGVSFDASNVTFAISGGQVDFKWFSVDAYLIGFRDPKTGLTIDFGPVNSIIHTEIDGCKGEVNISVNSISYKVDINIFAVASSYSNCLLGPEVVGFRPVCVESYDATAIFRISRRTWIPFVFIDEKKYIFTHAALEFGGRNVCKDKCS